MLTESKSWTRSGVRPVRPVRNCAVCKFRVCVEVTHREGERPRRQDRVGTVEVGDDCQRSSFGHLDLRRWLARGRTLNVEPLLAYASEFVAA